jgi:hypothetical protein
MIEVKDQHWIGIGKEKFTRVPLKFIDDSVSRRINRLAFHNDYLHTKSLSYSSFFFPVTTTFMYGLSNNNEK